ncbi:hypothetical protein ACUN7V_12445 [Quadrisphaera oryzae]|uniref:hypothetical protein n=1 Tax=Quadrisphaera TaxID=317661 RepID=UPI001645EF4E|nr:hypothetical protein [Quadrisphaera sp. RL12-1S]MBC3762016.1 hypothetical protein [Quadrisphaera sp. RL12-1S]
MTSAASAVVLDLVRAAADDGLLDDVGSLADGLTVRGWRRHRRGGVWVLDHPSDLTTWTSLTPPTLSVHLGSADDDAARAALADMLVRLEEVLGVPPQRDASHEPDQFSAFWAPEEVPGLHVSATLHPAASALVRNGDDTAPEAWLQVQVLREGGAGEADEHDPERARRLAREGTAVERWYLAGQRALPPDAVAALEEDDDPLVVSAVHGHAHIRAFVAGSA